MKHPTKTDVTFCCRFTKKAELRMSKYISVEDSAKYELDERTGDNATFPFILYANQNHPELKQTHPEWSVTCGSRERGERRRSGSRERRDSRRDSRRSRSRSRDRRDRSRSAERRRERERQERRDRERRAEREARERRRRQVWSLILYMAWVIGADLPLSQGSIIFPSKQIKNFPIKIEILAC